MSEDPITSAPVGPQAAGADAIEVDAVPDDGSPSSGAAPGALPAPDENVVAWKETLVMALLVLTRYATSRWPAMATTNDEIVTVADAWAPVCAKRWPIATTPEIAAALVTAGVFGPKIVNAITDEKRAKAERAAKAKAPAHDRDNPPDPLTSPT